MKRQANVQESIPSRKNFQKQLTAPALVPTYGSTLSPVPNTRQSAPASPGISRGGSLRYSLGLSDIHLVHFDSLCILLLISGSKMVFHRTICDSDEKNSRLKVSHLSRNNILYNIQSTVY